MLSNYLLEGEYPRLIPTEPLHSLTLDRYIGAHDANTSVTTYYSIPFAYSSRFEPSQLIDTKRDLTPDALVNATTHGPACVNFDLPPPYDIGNDLLLGTDPREPQAEDCLTMDIYVPDGRHEDLPVLFWTPGGGWLVGAFFPHDMKPMISRAASAEKRFIGVVINYRLGPLGLLNPSTWGNHVNIGLLDQINALRYVRKYIEAFGGSPHKVTISGQSAGAESTMYQMLWTDENLFRSAWMASVPASTAPFLNTEPQHKDSLVKSYGKACGCNETGIEDVVDCLRHTSVDTLTKNSAA